jgi:hypothetical protein
MKIESIKPSALKRLGRDWVEPRPAERELWYFHDERHLMRAAVLPVQQQSAIEVRFEELNWEWHQTRNDFSSGIDNFILPAYQQIIGLGPDAVPLILRALASELDDWFWALRAITGVDPVPGDHRGYLEAMRKDWFDWAKTNSISW